MDLRASIHEFVARAKELEIQLSSHEVTTLGRADLHILEIQLYLLEKKVQRCKETNRLDSLKRLNTPPVFPPFFSTKNVDGEGQRPEK